MMKLYSGPTCPFSHRCRIVLNEKGIDFQIIDVEQNNASTRQPAINPYGHVPALVDRDLVLHEANIINEYIDDRVPHPRLMPADPELRARARLFLYGIEQELFVHVAALEKKENKKIAEEERVAIRDQLTLLAPIFVRQPYLLGDEYSMLEVAIAPLLWRLDKYGIELPRQAVPLLDYAERLFRRPSFIHSLTSSERAMRSSFNPITAWIK